MKRKRRSFWEPENESVKQWMNSQGDLGKSIQILIMDWQARFGDKDAVSLYLDHVSHVPMVQSLDIQQSQAVQPKTETIPKKQAQPLKPVIEPKVEPQPVQTEQRVQPPVEPTPERQQTAIPQRQPEPNVQQTPPESTSQSETSNPSPIDLMFQDINSKMMN